MCKVIILNMLLCAVMLLSFTVNAHAEEIFEAEFYENAVTELKNDLDSDTLELLSTLGFDTFNPDEYKDLSFKETLLAIFDIVGDNLSAPLQLILIISVILILNVLSGSLLPATGKMSSYFDFISVLFVSLVSFSYIIELIAKTVNLISVLCGLMKMIIPVFTAIIAFGGNPTLASGSSAISLYISEVIILVCDEFLTPLLCMISAFCVSSGINSAFSPFRLVELIKKLFSFILGLLAAVYSGVLTIRDIVSADIDRISGNSIRFVLGSSVPVVGGTLSEGLSAVVSAVGLFKNTFGITGIIILIIACLPVFAGLFCWCVSFYISEFLASSVSNDKISELLSSFRYVVSMLISLLVFIIFIFLISISTLLILSNK